MNYTFARVVSFATKNFTRNIGLSMMIVTILVLSLLSIHTLVIVNSLTHASVAVLEKQVDVSVDFSLDATPEIVKKIVDTVASLSEVKESRLYSAQEVKELFQERHKDNKNILSALEALDHNPFGQSLSFSARTSSDYQHILSLLDREDFNSVIEKKSFGEHTEVLERIQQITTTAKRSATFFAAVFGLFAVCIIFNTIRVTLYTQRDEISIMRLVGASKWFIRMPTYVECMYYVLIALTIALSLTFFVVELIDPFVRATFSSTGFSIMVAMKQLLPGLVLFEFFGILFMCLVAATLAMRKYLKV